MRADQTSLIELGLLPDAAGTWPLATWLDHTHARRGHDALRRLIATPLHDIDALQTRQALLLALAPIAPRLAWRALYELADQVERYLGSSMVTVPEAFVARIVFSARYGDIVAEVAKGLRAVDALCTLSESVHTLLSTVPQDAAIVPLMQACARAAGDPHRAVLRAAVQQDAASSLAGLDAMVRDASSHHIGTEHPPLREGLVALIQAIPLLDALCSLAIASASLNGALPTLLPRGTPGIAFEELRHPLLPTSVTNDVHLEASERVLFLTGPNMAGKSTLLRAFGIAVYSAHLGMAVSARAARVPVHDQLLVSITVHDNILRGESLYLAEVRRVRTIVEAVDRGDAVLAIFDEVFRGTNISDATQATMLLVDGLAHATCGTFVIASHLASVAESRADHAGVSCWCLEVEADDIAPRFTYRVRPGVSNVQLGLVLLEREGVGPVLRRLAQH